MLQEKLPQKLALKGLHPPQLRKHRLTFMHFFLCQTILYPESQVKCNNEKQHIFKKLKLGIIFYGNLPLSILYMFRNHTGAAYLCMFLVLVWVSEFRVFPDSQWGVFSHYLSLRDLGKYTQEPRWKVLGRSHWNGMLIYGWKCPKKGPLNAKSLHKEAIVCAERR